MKAVSRWVGFSAVVACRAPSEMSGSCEAAMDLPDVISRFLSKPGAEETTPFGPDVLVYKVGGKMFALTVTMPSFPAIT